MKPTKKKIFLIDEFDTPIDFRIPISIVLFLTNMVKPDTILNLQIYGKILDLVDYLVPNGYFDITDGATHYHADYVRPDWAKTKTKTIEIEDHIFYRWEK